MLIKLGKIWLLSNQQFNGRVIVDCGHSCSDQGPQNKLFSSILWVKSLRKHCVVYYWLLEQSRDYISENPRIRI